MKTFKLVQFILLLSILFLSIPQAYSQCPENDDELILNTQEKHDAFFAKYPDCKEYNIIMMNGMFIGDPRPIPYLFTLLIVLGVIVLILKFLLDKFPLRQNQN